jgi:hypothetical protein
MAGTLTGVVAGIAAPEAIVKGIRGIPNATRSVLAGDVHAPITPGGITPLERYGSARAMGVNLDAADATNSGPLKIVKKVNENSLLGSNIYDQTKAANATALSDSTSKILKSMYNGDRESGGITVQNALKRNQQGLQSTATEGFQSLPQNIPLPGLEDVGKAAQKMAQDNAAYQDLFPSLKPNKAMSVVGDVGGLGPQPPAPIKLSPFVDESGQAIPSAKQPPPPAPKSFATGQQLRSDLLEFRRNNPDIVAGQGDAMVGQLAGGVDDALTGASAHLTPDQLQTFRDSNAKWADMKSTYDDPSNPLYHAVRTDNPSQLYSGIGPKTPEMVRNLEERLGPNIAPLRRGAVEGALKTTNDGSPNFKNFGTNLNRLPADYRSALFTPAQQEMLGHLQNTSNVMGQDFNPSGSAKLGQKIGEAGMLGSAVVGHPAGLLPLAQYPIARLMNSPDAVDWLMRPNSRVAAPSPALRLLSPALGKREQK